MGRLKVDMDIKGKCLCGKVCIHIPQASEKLSVCHCKMCQTFFSSSFIFVRASNDKFSMSGDESIQHYRSSEAVERGFCRECGTSLFYCEIKTKYYCFPIGLFENIDQQAVLKTEFYTEYKPKYVTYQQDTVKITEKQMLHE